MFDWNIKTVYRAAFIIVAINLLGSVALGLKQFEYFQRIDSSWALYADEVTIRQELLAQIKTDLGYGGFIHHFKNYVIRKDQKYYDAAVTSLNSAKSAIRKFTLVIDRIEEKIVLDDLHKTIDDYARVLTIASDAVNSGQSSEGIDWFVRVNDQSAFHAMNVLSAGTEELVTKSHDDIILAVEDGKTVLFFGLAGVSLFFVSGILLLRVLRRLSTEALNRTAYLDSINKSIPNGLIVFNDDGSVDLCNPALNSLIEVQSCKEVGFKLQELFPRFKDIDDLVQCLEESAWRCTVNVNGKDRTLLMGHEIFFIGKTKKLALSVTDITDLEEANQRLKSANDEVIGFKTLLEEHALVSMTDSQGIITYANDKFCQVSGYSRDELVGRKHNIVNSGTHPSSFWKGLWGDIRAGKVWHGEVTNRRKDGSYYWIYSTIMPFRNESGEIAKFVSARTDITQVKQAENRIHQLAYVDQLTTLPNIARFNETIESLKESALLEEEPSTFTIVDIGIERIPEFNGTFGWEYGDELILSIMARLQSIDFKPLLVAKTGGESFGLIFLNGSDANQAVAEIKQKLLSAFKAPLPVRENSIKVQLSCGALVYPTDLEDVESNKKSASDINRYLELCRIESRKTPESSLTRFSSSILKEVSLKTLILQNVDKAIQEGRIFMVYQPQICLKSGKIVGVEALMRWRRPDGGFVSPGEFIPVLEMSHHIIDVGIWVNRTCFAALKEIHKHIPQCRMGINISANFLTADNFVEEIEVAVRESGLEPSMIELEVTESGIMSDLNVALAQLKALKDQGFRISIDDFGTGHSSLSYLATFPVDQLKIDKSFVRCITENDQSLNVVRTIISLSKLMNFDVIAEGTETLEQVEILKAERCDEVQGFYYAKPMPLNELIDWYHTSEHQV